MSKSQVNRSASNLASLQIRFAPSIANSSHEALETFDIDRHNVNDRVRLFLKQHRKIDAIKLVRAVTNWSLKESKDYIDVAPLPITESGPVKEQLNQLIANRRHMDAIQLFQRRTGMMVTEVKDYLEQTFNCDFPF